MGASVWAYRATDMRGDLARGFLTSFSLDRIVSMNDTDAFHGIFAIPQASVGGVFDPFQPCRSPGTSRPSCSRRSRARFRATTCCCRTDSRATRWICRR